MLEGKKIARMLVLFLVSVVLNVNLYADCDFGPVRCQGHPKRDVHCFLWEINTSLNAKMLYVWKDFVLQAPSLLDFHVS